MKRFALITILAALILGVAAMPGSAASFDDTKPCPASGPLLVCPTMHVGVPVNLQLLGHDGCNIYRWEYTNGSLPQGLTMSSSGLITGTPTRAETTQPWMIIHDLLASQGGYSWCGGDNQSQRQFVFTVVGASGGAPPPPPPAPAPPPPPQPALQITTASLPQATAETPYSASLAASGGSGYSWSVSGGSLPTGLTLGADGALTGTPASGGNYTFAVKVTSGGRSTTRQLTLVVVEKLTVTAPTDQTWEVGRPLKVAISAAGGSPSYRWSLDGSLPDKTGFVGNEGNGATSYLQGVPAQAGTFPLTLTVTDTAGRSAKATVTLTVAPKLQITTFATGRAHRGKPYRLTLRSTGGVGPTSWTLTSGSLPTGLTLDDASGVISGKPHVRGHFVFALAVTDSLGAKRAMRYSLTVARR